VAVALSAKRAIADSGTIVAALSASAWPPDGSRAAVRLAVAEVAAPAAPAAAAVPVLEDTTFSLPPAARAGTYTSFSASGDCAYFCATPITTWYWFSSS
jgi:hypothetical protein